MFHVGPPKTGTTYLQKYVFPHFGIESCERKFGNYKTGYCDWKESADRLYQERPNDTILITKRNKEDMLKSLYSEYLKQNGCARYSEFRKKFDDFDFDEVVAYYRSLFPEVHVLDFTDFPFKAVSQIERVTGKKFEGRLPMNKERKRLSRTKHTCARLMNLYIQRPLYFLVKAGVLPRSVKRRIRTEIILYE